MKSQIQHLGLWLMAYGLWLMPYGIQAQDYQYQWAKSGGGGLSGSGTGFNEQQDETIRDVVVDADNNYYFLADLQGGTVNYDGISLTHYGSKDIVIIALDCEGSFLWSNTIGGSNWQDNAYKLELDSSNGLYIAVSVLNQAYVDNLGNEHNFPPVHFSEDDVMSLVPAGSGLAHEGYKMGFLLKFDKDTGELLWRKDLQGLVTQSKRGIGVGRVFIDSNDIVHQIVGLWEGTHLDGLVTVPEGIGYGEGISFLVKYDTDGNILGIPQELPMTEGFTAQYTLFTYDEQLNRYYLAGVSGLSLPKTYGGVPLQESGFYILAFDGDTFDELWRRELISNLSMTYEEIKQIAIDEDSNIYIAGKCFIFIDEPAYFGDYAFPQNIGSYEHGHIPFTLKLNSSGAVQWIRTPDGYTNSTAATGTYFNRGITLNGNEVAVLPNSGAHIWGDFSINRPVSHRADPVILRLDKETGEVIGLHDMLGGSGVENEFRVITTDNDGNYVAGGHFFGVLENPSTGEPMYGMGKTDFFMAKLSAYACGSGGPGTNPCEDAVIPVPTGDSSQTLTAGMTLADLDVEGENLQWYADPALTEPLAETHTVVNGVTYYVTQAIGSCISEALEVTVTTLGVSDFQKLEVKLHPNPTSGMVYIEASQNLQSYEVYNLIGQKLLSDSFTGSINMQDLSRGTYIIRLTTQSGEVFTEKVVRQ